MCNLLSLMAIEIFGADMKKHIEVIHSQFNNQDCDFCSKLNPFGADIKKHIEVIYSLCLFWTVNFSLLDFF